MSPKFKHRTKKEKTMELGITAGSEVKQRAKECALEIPKATICTLQSSRDPKQIKKRRLNRIAPDTTPSGHYLIKF